MSSDTILVTDKDVERIEKQLFGQYISKENYLRWHKKYSEWLFSDANELSVDSALKDPIKYYCGFGFSILKENILGIDSHHTNSYKTLLTLCSQKLDYWVNEAPTLKQDMYVFRAVKKDEFDELKKNKFKQYPSFLSTTIIDDPKKVLETFGKEYILKILVPKNSKCAYVKELVSTGQERELEVIFPKGMELQVFKRHYFSKNELECVLHIG